MEKSGACTWPSPAMRASIRPPPPSPLSQLPKSLEVISTLSPTPRSICWIATTMRWSKTGEVKRVKVPVAGAPTSLRSAFALFWS